MSKVRNDPSIAYDTTGPPRDYARKVEYTRQGHHAVARKTEKEKSYSSPIHKTAHTLNQCRVLKLKSFEERKRWLRENNYCYKCCEVSDHNGRQCQVKVQCTICNSYKHLSALHIDTNDKVSKGAKIRIRYNQIPHLTQDTNGKVTNSQLDTTNESQEVSPFPAGDNKAYINRCAQRQSKHKTEQKHKRSTKEVLPWNGQ